MPQAPAAPWRVVILTSIAPVAIGYAALTRAAGHQPVAVITPRRSASDAFLAEGTDGMDIAIATTKRSIAPLLAAYRADLGLCTGFPWLVPKEAIETPPLGIVNGHPSLLPRYRGPFPIAWAARNGEREIGLSYHFMDAAFDTGNLLAQTSIPLDENESDETLIPKLEAAAGELLPQVFARLAAGDDGEPQEDGEYFHGFEPEYVAVDTRRSAAEVHRQVWAWSFMPAFVQDRGAIHERDGMRRRLRRTSLEEVEGAERLDCADGLLWIIETESA